MKKSALVLMLCLFLIFTGCNSNKEFNGLSLPFSADTIETIGLIHHTGDPSNAEKKVITDSEDINYIHTMLSSDILIKDKSVDGAAQTDTLYITFHFYDGTGYTIRFDSYGVKRGIISSEDTPKFTYFTSADVCWIWGQLAKEYEGKTISIADEPYATEKPVAEENN